MSEAAQRQLLRLTALLQLEQRARRMPPGELPFLLVNDTASVVRYAQAWLWDRAEQRVIAVSGVAQVDPGSPYMRLIQQLMKANDASAAADTLHVIVPEDATLPEPVRAEWSTWLPAALMLVPLPGLARSGTPPIGHVLALVRPEPWTEAEQHLLALAGDGFGHALAAAGLASGARLPGPIGARRTSQRSKRRTLWLGIAAAIVLLGLLPVDQTVLAPAEVVPAQPYLIRAPLAGVVDRIAVAPSAAVKAGEVLAMLDDRELRARRDVALKTHEIAEAELLQATQAALRDPEAKGRLAALQGRVDLEAAEAVYLEAQLQRVSITAPQDGIALFDDPNDWIGRPVAQGERLMMLADPAKVELEIRLPASETLPIALGSAVDFFLNIAPEAPVAAKLTRVGYRSVPGPDGRLVFRLNGAFQAGPAESGTPAPRLGLSGTARLHAGRTIAALWLLRRPLASIRQWLGL